MAADIKAKYGTSNQPIKITLASLGSTNLRESNAIDNSSYLFLDVLVFLKIKAGASASATGVVNVYAYGSADGGTSYSDTCTGSDAGITLTNPPNLRLIGVINVVSAGVTYKGGPFSVAQAFGGMMPDHWGIVIENKSGGSLDATEGNHAKFYQGVYAQSV